MIIDGREIDSSHSPYIIAEASCNHNGDLANAMKLIKAAKEAGADAVKFQCYEADSLTIDGDQNDFTIKEGPWAGRSLYGLYQKTQTPFSWFPILFDYARSKGITPFASVFDKAGVDLLERLDCPAYKIASMEITDIPLIEYAASTGKPLIISTGMATDDEVAEVVFQAFAPRTEIPALLHCVSGYPTKSAESNLGRLLYFNSRYACPLGISDHSVGDAIPIAATALGACIIEKHLMLGIEDTEDFEFSMDPIQFKNMVREVRNIWQAMQPPESDVEASSRQLRRSLYVVKDIEHGEPFTEDNIRSIRPSYGLPPKELPWLLTKRAAADLKRGTAMKYDYVE